MQAQIRGQFGVEGGGQHIALTHGHDAFTAVGIHLVYQSDEEQEDRSKWKVMLTFSNPHTKEMIRSSLAVTGDNDYGE